MLTPFDLRSNTGCIEKFESAVIVRVVTDAVAVVERSLGQIGMRERVDPDDEEVGAGASSFEKVQDFGGVGRVGAIVERESHNRFGGPDPEQSVGLRRGTFTQRAGDLVACDSRR